MESEILFPELRLDKIQIADRIVGHDAELASLEAEH